MDGCPGDFGGVKLRIFESLKTDSYSHSTAAKAHKGDH
jgi:hypothetical protein